MVESALTGLAGDFMNCLGQVMSRVPVRGEQLLLREAGFGCELLPLSETDFVEQILAADFRMPWSVARQSPFA